MAHTYLGDADSCSVYIVDERLTIERKIRTVKQEILLKCLNNGKMWNSKIIDTLHGDEYVSSGNLEKISQDIEKKLGIKIISRENLEKMLSSYYIGP